MAATPRTIEFTEEDLAELRRNDPMVKDRVPSYVPTPPAFNVWSYEDLKYVERGDWMLRSTIQEGGLTILHGDSKAGKTLIALQWAMTLARTAKNVSWMGQPRGNNGPYNVLYMAGEGQSGLFDRMEGWKKFNSTDEDTHWDNLKFVTNAVDLNPVTSDAAQALLNTVKHYKTQVVFLDTLQRMFRGNENQAEDVQTFLKTIQALQDEDVATVVLHHNRKSDDEMRGSTALYASADMIVKAKAETKESMYKAGTVELDKIKDGPLWAGKKELRRESYLPYPDQPDYDVPVLVESTEVPEMGPRLKARAVAFFRDNGPTKKSDAQKRIKGSNGDVAEAIEELINDRVLGGGAWGEEVYLINADEVEGL